MCCPDTQVQGRPVPPPSHPFPCSTHTLQHHGLSSMGLFLEAPSEPVCGPHANISAMPTFRARACIRTLTLNYTHIRHPTWTGRRGEGNEQPRVRHPLPARTELAPLAPSPRVHPLGSGNCFPQALEDVASSGLSSRLLLLLCASPVLPPPLLPTRKMSRCPRAQPSALSHSQVT